MAPDSFGLLQFLILVGTLVAGVFVVGRWWRIGSPELFVVVLVMTAIVPFGFMIGLSSRLSLPLSVAIGFGWLFFRRKRTRPAAIEAPDPRPRRPVEQPLPRPPVTAPAQARTIFVSYRRSDSADITGRIYDRLAQRFGREHVYKDVDSIPLGVDFRKRVGDLVGRCDALIAVIGARWLAAEEGGKRRIDDPRDLVRVEIGAALARGIPVIPVLVGGSEVPSEETLPAELRELAYRNGIAVRPDPDFHNDVDRLISGLEDHFRLPA